MPSSSPAATERRGGGRAGPAFTLVELLVSMVVLASLLVLLASFISQAQRMVRQTQGRIEAFREARTAFDALTRRIEQATLNTYWDYEYANGSPTRYVRQSELRFACGHGLVPPPSANGGYHPPNATAAPGRPGQAVFFQAPLGFTRDGPPANDASGNASYDYGGLDTLLNTCGYYVEYNDDGAQRPAFIQQLAAPAALPSRNRFRLMELTEPSEALTLYQYTSGLDPASGQARNGLYTVDAPPAGQTGWEWFQVPLAAPARSRVLAENILALVAIPRLTPQDERRLNNGNVVPLMTFSQAGNTVYDSSHAVAATSALDRARNSKNQLPPLVQVTMVALDETSAQRLDDTTNRDPITALGLDALFHDQAKFHDGTDGAGGDLTTLTNQLVQRRLNYRVFTSDVAMRSAKWSVQQ